MPRSLFAISDDLLALADLMTETGGEIPEGEVGAALEKYFNDLGEERDQKLDAYGWVIRELEARGEARQAEAARLNVLAASDAGASKRLKDRLKYFMDGQAVTKIETDHFKFAVQKNGGKAPLDIPDTWHENPACAPERYHKISVSLNKDLIREDLEAGEVVPSCEIAEKGTHLRIR